MGASRCAAAWGVVLLSLAALRVDAQAGCELIVVQGTEEGTYQYVEDDDFDGDDSWVKTEDSSWKLFYENNPADDVDPETFIELWADENVFNYFCWERAWYLRDDDRDEFYGVLDCANNPTDITSTRWRSFSDDDANGVPMDEDDRILATCIEDFPSLCTSIEVEGPFDVGENGYLDEGELFWNGSEDDDQGWTYGRPIFRYKDDLNLRLEFILRGANTFVLPFDDLNSIEGLYSCDTGSWAFVDRDDDTTVIAAMDCVSHPLEISTPWIQVSCQGCEPFVLPIQPELTCAAYNGQPAPSPTGGSGSSGSGGTVSGRSLTDSAIAAIAISVVIVVIAACLAATRIAADRMK